MLTAQDIKLLTEYQLEVFKEVFVTKEELKDLKKDFNEMKISIDILAKGIKNQQEINASSVFRFDRNERWIQRLAKKHNLKLEY